MTDKQETENPFRIRDKVRLSPQGRKQRPLLSLWGEEIGVVNRQPQSKSEIVRVRWPGRKQDDRLHYDCLEFAE